jgi:hypothetical protein
MSNLHNPDPTVPFKEDDIEEIIKAFSFQKIITLDRGSRKILLELAQTFMEEVLDLTPSDKANLTTSAINRQIALKFPEISKESVPFTIDYLQRRGIEIEKEEMN